MTLFCEVSGNRVVHGTITIPFLGIWHADLLMDQVVELSGLQTVTLGPLSLKGTSILAGTFSGSTRTRIVGGYAGWRKALPAKNYQHDLGVKKSTVLGDAAREAGEKLFQLTDGILGTKWVREQAIAARTLELCGDTWWMRGDAVTVVGTRDSSAIASHFNVISTQLAIGQLFVATDDVQDWIPGRTFSTPVISTRTISSVMHHIEKESIRTEAWVL
jgi:hypothetical protein